MRRLVFLLEGPEGRIDRVEHEAGAILTDSTSMKRANPQAAVSALLGAYVEDDETGQFEPGVFLRGLPERWRVELVRFVFESAARARAARERHTAVYLDNDDPKGTPDA